jgi:hypothetical protein
VRVVARYGDTEISWACRDQLLDQIRDLDAGRDVVAAFEAVGATRPVIFQARRQGDRRPGASRMARQAGGMHKPSRGCIELRHTLLGELDTTADAAPPG